MLNPPSHKPYQSPVLIKANLSLKVLRDKVRQIDSALEQLQRRLDLLDEERAELMRLGQVVLSAREGYLRHEDGAA